MCWVVQQQGEWLVRLLQPLVLALGCLIHGKSNLLLLHSADAATGIQA